jgi:hypothetical protein
MLSRNSICAHSNTRSKLKYLAYFPVQGVFRASGMDVSRIRQYHSIQKQCSPKLQVPTGGSALYILARHSSHKAGTILSPEGKALRVEQNVLKLVCVISRNILAVLLNRGDSVLLLDEALCVLGSKATVEL